MQFPIKTTPLRTYFSASSQQLPTSNYSTVRSSSERRTGDSFASTQKKQVPFSGTLEKAKEKRDKAKKAYDDAVQKHLAATKAYTGSKEHKAVEEAYSKWQKAVKDVTVIKALLAAQKVLPH